MIFHKLQFKDILTFKGKQTIEFEIGSSSEDRSPLTIILSPNSGGKTSVMRLLQFLFYGHANGINEDTEFPNRNTMSTLNVGDKLECWVEAVIERPDGETETIRRILEVTKRSETNKLVTQRLEKIRRTERGDVWDEDSGGLQARISNYVPEGLFPMFYFKGEELKESLFEQRSNDIKNALGDLLHESKWKQAFESLQKVRRRLQKKHKDLSAKNNELQQKQLLFQNLSDNLDDAKSTVRKLEDAIEIGKQNISKLANDIRDLAEGAEKSKEINLQKERLEGKRDSLKLKRENLEQNITNRISDSHGIPFISHELENLQSHLKILKDRKLLPSEIAEGYLVRILNDQTCICGRPLDPKEDKLECSKVEDLMKDSIESFVSSKLMELYDSVSGDKGESWKKKSEFVYTSLEDLRMQQQQLSADFEDCLEELESTNRNLINSSGDQSITEKYEKLCKEKDLYEVQLNKNKEQLNEENRKVNLFTAQFQKVSQELGSKNDSEYSKFMHCATAINRSQEAEDTLVKLLTFLKASFHQILTEDLEEKSEEYVTNNCKCVVDEETLLPRVLYEGQEVGGLGGAETQFYTVAYVSALARLRKKLHQDLKSFGIYVGNLGRQSFFLDSVFGSAGDSYRKAIAKLIPESAVQSVVLLAEQQWTSEVIDELTAEDHNIYVFRHYPGHAQNARDAIFKVGNKEVNLVEDAVDEAYSVIEKL